MKTVAMARTEKDKKAEAERYAVGSPIDFGDRPLILRLEEPELKKLGLGGDDLPKDGKSYRFEGRMTVKGGDFSSREGNRRRSVEMVIDELGLEPTQSDDKEEKEPSLREEIVKARHQPPGSARPSIGARVAAR